MKDQHKSILVIGGAGFIGSHTVDLLLQEGHRVRVLDNFSSGRKENLPWEHPHLEIVSGDLEDGVLLERAFDQAQAVLHLAAQVSVQRSLEDPLGSCRQNILNFVRVLEQARRHGTRVVYASSAAVYGDPEVLPVDEQAPVRPVSPYGLEKYSNELYAELYGRIHGLSHLGLRYFNVYGPRQDPGSPYSGVISRFVDQIRKGQALTVRGDGLQGRDFIHVADVARANLAALFASLCGVVNIAGGQVTTVRRLAELIIELHGGKGSIEGVPPLPGDIRHSRADIGRMQQFLIAPGIPLDQGLQDLLDGGMSRARSVG